jgi:tRNA threonylcarbamoyladenosine biosynthesis protein TsaE
MDITLKKALLKDESASMTFAYSLACKLQRGTILALYGDLGSGKTFICREIIRSLIGPEAKVTSPTFNLLKVYEGRDIEIYHFDLYRLKSIEESYELGIEEAFSDNNICLIEWPEIIEPILPKDAIKLKIEILKDGSRLITAID